MDGVDSLRRDGFTVRRGLVDPARTDRLRVVADGLRERYFRRDPVSGQRGFLVAPWRIVHPEHRGFFAGVPGWWFPALMGLIADPAILELWHAATGVQPQFAVATLFMDPLMPLGADLSRNAAAAADGAGPWHRDTAPRADEDEREQLLGGGLEEAGHILEVALVPSDAFEYVPGSHARWDTPLELVARKHGTTIDERTQPLPGACRLALGAGDAVLADTRGIHRGWYTRDIPRRTLTLWYLSDDRLSRLPGEKDNLCRLDAAQIELLPAAVGRFFQRSLPWRPEGGAQ